MFSLISLGKACLEEHLLSIIYYQGVHFCLVVVPRESVQTSEAAVLEETCKALCVYLCCMWKSYMTAEQTGPRFCLSLIMLVLEENAFRVICSLPSGFSL